MEKPMSTIALTNRLELNSVADTALKAAAQFWFDVAIIGQLVFAFAVASYGAARRLPRVEQIHQSWLHLRRPMGNFAVALCIAGHLEQPSPTK
jgi:hypothetical protein